MRLTIAYSAIAAGVADIAFPEPADGVELLVIAQGDAPAASVRPDVRLVRLDSLGVAKSRNAALREAKGEMVLFADDDSTIELDGVRQVLDQFDADAELALVLGMASDGSGRARKRYPRRPARLTRWNSARAGTIEMMVRRSIVLDAGIAFDERFGAGTENFLGDEYVFICDALGAGLTCVFLPIFVAGHVGESSGVRYGSVADARARAAVFDRVFGRLAPIVRLLFVARRPSRFRRPSLTLRFVLGRLGDQHGVDARRPLR